jgi:hypothetical protein
MFSYCVNLRRRLYWHFYQVVETAKVNLRLSFLRVLLLSTRRKPRFLLSGWYGRTGNNLQQLLVALLHAKCYSGIFSVTSEQLAAAGLDDLLHPFCVDFSPDRDPKIDFTSNFFHYTENLFFHSSLKRMWFLEGTPPRRECLIGKAYIEKNIFCLAQKHLAPSLISRLANSSPQLVLCLRAGELRNLTFDFYVTNPLYFYKILSGMYDSVLIVTEPGDQHFLLPSICQFFASHKIVHVDYGSRHHAFEILTSATSLATSGVSTFPLSAALLSRNLRHLVCSSCFMDEHLNPMMLSSSNVKVDIVDLPGYESLWRKSSPSDRVDLLFDYHPGLL